MLLPTVGLIQHTAFFTADRYMYIPLTMMAPIMGSMACAWYTFAFTTRVPSLPHVMIAGGPVPDIAIAATTVGGFNAQALAKAAAARGGKTKGKGTAAASHFSDTPDSDGPPPGKVPRRWPLAVAFFSLTGAAGVGVAISAAWVTPSNLRRWRTSELLWSRNVEVFPDVDSAHTNLVQVYLKGPSRDVKKAVHHARRAVEITPNSPKYFYNLGKALVADRDYDEAVTFLRKAVRITPEGHYWYLMLKLYLAKALREKGQYGEAREQLEGAMKAKHSWGKRSDMEGMVASELRTLIQMEERRKEKAERDKAR